MRYLVLLAAGLTLAACAPTLETPAQAEARQASETAAVQKIIDSTNTDFEGHFNAGHGDLVAAQYSEDAELMLGGQPVAKGRAAIAGMVNAMATMKAALKLTSTSVARSGPIAVERGTYTISIQPPGAPSALTEEGNFLVHWHLIGGKWTKVHDLANSPNPLPAAQAPAKK